MKKLFKYFISCTLILLCVTTSCSENKEKKQRRGKDISLAKVLLNKELVIGVGDDFPPFAYYDTTSLQLVGYDIDMLKAVADTMGVKPVFRTIDFSKKDFFLNTNKIDCMISGFSYTPTREKLFTLSIPYIKTATIFAVKQDSKYTNIYALKNKTIGIQNTSSMKQALRKTSVKYGGFTNIKYFDTAKGVLGALKNGTIDAVVADILVINHLIKKYNAPYDIIPKPLDSDRYVIAFKLNNIKLKNKIEEALFFLAENGTLETLSKKWFGVDISIIGK